MAKLLKVLYENILTRIKNKLLLLIILAEFLSCGILFLCSSTIYSNSIEKKAINYNMTEINNINNSMDIYFNQIDYIAYTLSYNPVIQSYFVFHDINSYDENAKKGNEISNILSALGVTNNNLQITVFRNESDYTFFSSGYMTTPGYNLKNDDWYKAIQKSNKEKIILLNNPQKYLHESSRKPVYSIVYRCTSVGGHNTLGYIIMDINKNQIEQFFKTSNIDIKSTLIADESNKLVYTSNNNFKLETIKSYIPNSLNSGYLAKSINGIKYLIIFGTSRFTGWKIINIVSYESLFKDIKYMKYLILFISIILLSITVYITYKFTDIITKPIEKLKGGMYEVSKGNFNFSITEQSQDELGELVKFFNRMSSEIQYLIKEAESSKYLKKEAQLKSLQQQINPHFLYNTLEMIIGLAQGENREKIKIICKSLGYMFRYNLNSGNVVTIEEELEQIKRYAYIMEQRFEGRFKVYYEVDEEVLKFKTLKFFLQPLVENSINHGFCDIVEDGEIKINILKKDDLLEFNIIDNGEGFDEHTLDKINQEFQASSKNIYDYIEPYDHIGIINVHLRFLMLFKNDYKINIKSIPFEETCIKIQIPII